MGQPQNETRRAQNLFTRWLSRFLRDGQGNIAPLMALLLVPIIGSVAVGIEVSNWYTAQRDTQNAADSSAVAAAMNNTAATYQDEARSVASKYGFVNGSNHTTVTPINNQTCPDGQTDCYRVTIERDIPVYLTRIVGFNGDSGTLKRIVATALASNGKVEGYCLVTLAHGIAEATVSMTFNGVPTSALKDCNIHTNTSVVCHGMDEFDASIINGPGTVKDCDEAADTIDPNAAAITDPWASTYNQIPPTTGCTNTNITQAQFTATPVLKKCSAAAGGVVKLGANISVDGSSLPDHAILVIGNGASLDMNGFNLTGTAFTVIFTGAAGGAPGQIINSKNGTTPVVTITNPDSPGATYDMQGMAIYQDPRMTTGTNWTYSGGKNNQIQWAIQGRVYLPYVNFTMNGSINKTTYACLSLITDQMTISGGGQIFADPTSQCDRAGVTLPGVNSRPRLVG